MPAVGSSVQPCRSGQLDRLHAALRRLRKRPVELVAAWYARPVNSRYGRPIRRASATPCSRCRCPSNRVAQTSVMPRLTSASARSSSPRPGCAASGASAAACSRCACSATAGRFAALPGQQQPDHPEQHLRLPAPAGRHRRRSRAPPAPGTVPPPPATPGPAHRPRPAPPARHPPRGPRRGTRPAAHAWWRPAHPDTGPASGRPAAGRPAPSPAPPGRAGSPPPGTRAPQTSPAASSCSAVTSPGSVRRSSSCSRSANRWW